MAFSGLADLPLHGGHVPAWLARYMRRLAEALLEALVELYGPDVAVERFSDPFWFQAFNNAIGMDWDSSGSTTVTVGILKQVTWSRPELGIVVLGGKGTRARGVPEEAQKALDTGMLSDRMADEVLRISRLSAKTDSVLLQDGYQLYHHSLIVSEHRVVVVQQGMNVEARMARRYHWMGPLPKSEPTLEPHSGIAAAQRASGIEYDLTARRSIEARKLIPDLIASTHPSRLVEEVARAARILRGDASLETWLGGGSEIAVRARVLRRYYRPQRRPPRHLAVLLRQLHDSSPSSLEELVLAKGVGAAVMRSLALVAELLYGVPVSHKDPATAPIDPFRYAYVVGGKDGVPFPFRRDYAEKVIEFLRSVVEEARLDNKSRQRVLARLERMASMLPR